MTQIPNAQQRAQHITSLEESMRVKKELLDNKKRLHGIFSKVNFRLDEEAGHIVMLGHIDLDDYFFLYKQDIFPNHAFRTTRNK